MRNRYILKSTHSHTYKHFSHQFTLQNWGEHTNRSFLARNRTRDLLDVKNSANHCTTVQQKHLNNSTYTIIKSPWLQVKTYIHSASIKKLNELNKKTNTTQFKHKMRNNIE